MKTTEIGRLALRQEGQFWNAYWVPQTNNMDRAILLGCIRIGTIKGTSVREEFIDLMQHAFNNIVKDVIGETPTWSKPRNAPENERGGNA